MTEPKNVSTRRLKREYLRAVKAVWFWESASKTPSRTPISDQTDLANAALVRDACAKELRHRGWSA